MKAVLDWIKANPIIVVCIALIVISLPIAYVVSSGMRTSLKEEQQQTFDQEKRKLTGLELTYEVPAFGPHEERLSQRGLPNDVYRDWSVQNTSARREAAEQVAERVVAFNRKDYGVLVEGLFPEPADDAARRQLPADFLRLLIGTRGRSSAYVDLLREMNPVQPPSAAGLVSALQSQYNDFVNQKITERGAGDLLPDEERQLRELLIQRRLQFIQNRALQGSVYAPRDLLLRVAQDQDFGLPSSVPDQGAWNPVQRFADQFDYWTIAEVVGAISSVNGDQFVPDAAIKRIEGMQLGIWAGRGVQSDDSRGPGERSPTGFDRGPPTISEQEGVAGADPSVSGTITGRITNKWYEVRTVDLQLIVESARMPEIINGLTSYGFISVLDVDVEQIDAWEHARAGYAYGTEHVIRMNIELEIVFLREWMTPFMPASVKERLGIRDEQSRDF